MHRIAALLLLTVALAGSAPGALAQTPAPAGDAEVSARIAWIQRSLEAGRPAANGWWYGWIGGYTAATAGQLAVYNSSDDAKQRQDMLVGAWTTGIGAAGLLVFPLEAGPFAPRLREAPADTPEARRAKLATAEAYLRKAAAQESFGRSWKAHALSAAVNLAAGLVIWKHYDRPSSDALVTFAIGQAISEAQIFTQPMRAVRDLRAYESTTDFTAPATTGRTERGWYFGAAPGGVVAGVRF